ncbi:MAG TPA: hypothetical protein DCZ12_17540 [Gammaproteobacteria bacterium]|nr:hypothetical protein [Gammaproteobacteria bacterium]
MSIILGANGRKLATTHHSRVAISGSDDGETWRYIKPDDVPEWIKDERVMADIVSGLIVSEHENGPYYFGEVIH